LHHDVAAVADIPHQDGSRDVLDDDVEEIAGPVELGLRPVPLGGRG